MASQAGSNRLWLVDNGSTDGSVGFIREQFPAVHALEMGRNLGFGTAYNRAITACDAEFIVLLNNDTVVQPGWLEALLTEAEAHPEAAAVGSKLLFLEHPDVLNHAGGFLTPLGSAFDTGFGAPDGPAFDTARAVGCATGAAMLVRREAFLTVGGFDESYFAYFEDADLCWRFWLRGWTVRYAPAARVLHAYGGSTGPGRLSPFRIEHCQMNRLQNMFRNLATATLLRTLPASLAFDAYRVAGLLTGGERDAASAHLRGTRRFLALLPHVLAERRRVQASRVRSDQELRRLGVLVSLGDAAREWRRIAKHDTRDG